MCEPGVGSAELVCETVPAPVFVLDSARCVVAANQALLDLLDYPQATFVGAPIAEFMAGSSVRFFKDVFWPAVFTSDTAEDRACELITGGGANICIRLTGRGLADASGAVRHVVCVAEDFTERTLSEAKFTTLFALSPTPILVRRLTDSRILDANQAFLSLTGYGADALTGRTMEEVATFEPAHLRHRFEQDLRAGRPVRAADMRVKTEAGEALDLRATTAAIHAFNQSCAMILLQDPARGRFDEQQLFSAIEMVMRDTSWLSRQVVEKLAAVRTPRSTGTRVAALDDLTKREREVLAMISHGWSDADIASRLSLTRSTVRNHVAALYGKIGVHSRSSAIVWARERALNIIHPVAGLGQQPKRLLMATQPQP